MSKREIMDKIAEAFLKSYDGEEEEKKFAEKIRKAKDYNEVVKVFIRAAWDLPAFEDLVKGLKIPIKDKKELLGIASVKRGWST